MQIYREAYIGKNKDIIDSNFNILAFLLGPIYAFYRRVDTLGILLIITYILFIPMPIIIVFINILVGFEFKKYYYIDMDNKIRNILSNSKFKSKKRIINTIKDIGNPKINSNFIINSSLLIPVILIGIIINTSSISNTNKLDYKLPSSFEEIDNNTKYVSYESNDDNHNCVFSVSDMNYKYYKDEISYIKATDNTNSINKININNNEWFNYKFYNKDIYVIKKDNYFYKVIFSTYRDDDEYCMRSKNNFIDSLEFSEV
ncbi:MAG: DUF2628 domain-containing protein [Bacilli bacterium]|nr:DUF2628 domain-containing protein [Bacilli bacterium]